MDAPMTRRRRLGAVLFAVLILTSGCLSLVTGGTAQFDSSPATVSESALSETGYSESARSSENVTRNFTVAGQERTVQVTNHVAQYERNVSLGPLGEYELARFVAFSTPAVEIAGQTFNPVADWSERRIVRELSAEYSGLSDVTHVNNRSVQSLGEGRSVAKFSGRATVMAGQEVDVVLHVTKFRHGDDFVLAVGIHPQQLPDEQVRVNELFRGLQH